MVKRSTTSRTHKPIVVWLIDDTREHHLTAETTLAAFPSIRFTGFLDADEAISEFEKLAIDDPNHLPNVVLMDYYLGDWRGDAVTLRLRELEPPGAIVTIIGYSSVSSGSEAILGAGGDVALRKHRDSEGRNPSLFNFMTAWLKNR